VAHSGAGFRLRGLSENTTYRVKPLDGKLVEKQEILSGSFLMNHGLNLRLEGDFDSTAVLLERID
jgi:alpha-galactosidase